MGARLVSGGGSIRGPARGVGLQGLVALQDVRPGRGEGLAGGIVGVAGRVLDQPGGIAVSRRP